MGGAREARFTPFLATCAVVAWLITPSARAAPLVTQFRREPGASVAEPSLAAGVCKSPACFGPYADLPADDAAGRPTSGPGAAVPGALWPVLLGRLRMTAFLLFLFPQYTVAAAVPPPPPPTLVQMPPHIQGREVIPPAEFGTFPYIPFFPPPHTPPPVSEAPEPAGLLSGVLGAGLAGAFAWLRRRRCR